MWRLPVLPRRSQLGLVFGLISVLSITTATVFLATGSGATPGDSADAHEESAERGLHLFVNKGCIRCHGHERARAEVDGVQSMSDTGAMGSGPDLTDYRGDADFLRGWLADPMSVRPDTTMPNLNLDDDEIEALIAFLNESEDQT